MTLRIVVTGIIGTFPVGGVAWDYGQYALGFEELGAETYYLEDCGHPMYDVDTGLYTEDPEKNVAFLASTMAGLSPTLGRRWHMRTPDGQCFGLSRHEMLDILGSADVFLNVSSSAPLRREYLPSRHKVLLDTDPGWNHFTVYPRWQHPDPAGEVGGFHDYDHFFTYALNIEGAGCNLPTFGVSWHPTVPPVVLDRWHPEPPGTTWTTVMSWNNYRGSIDHEGQSYGGKELEFDKVEQLSRLADVPLELAAGGARPPMDRWGKEGWSVVDSVAVSATPDDYRRYIQSSRGEVSVAKNIYVATMSGWFSCRSTCYLAASRPVILQDTGFSQFIPAHEGIVTFADREGALGALEEVEANYEDHAAAARHVAETHFAAPIVLADMLERIGVG